VVGRVRVSAVAAYYMESSVSAVRLREAPASDRSPLAEVGSPASGVACSLAFFFACPNFVCFYLALGVQLVTLFC
jgi:hypothetical protein